MTTSKDIGRDRFEQDARGRHGTDDGITDHGVIRRIHREQEWNLALIETLVDRENRNGTLNPFDEALLTHLERATTDNGLMLLRASRA